MRRQIEVVAGRRELEIELEMSAPKARASAAPARTSQTTQTCRSDHARAAIAQQSQALDLRRLEPEPEEHHRESDARLERRPWRARGETEGVRARWCARTSASLSRRVMGGSSRVKPGHDRKGEQETFVRATTLEERKHPYFDTLARRR